MGWLIRFCFNRKNKTLRSIFRQKSVLSLLEKNYKTLHALNVSRNASAEDIGMLVDLASLSEGDDKDPSMDLDDERDDEEVEVEENDAMADKSDFKEKVLSVLKQGDFEEKRSSKLYLWVACIYSLCSTRRAYTSLDTVRQLHICFISL